MNKFKISYRSIKSYLSKIGAYNLYLIIRILIWDQLGIWINNKFYIRKYLIIEEYLKKRYFPIEHINTELYSTTVY